MGLQFDTVTAAPDSSLTYIVDDLMSRRSDERGRAVAVPADLETWLNALLRQSIPLVGSRKGRAQLEAWLDAVDTSPELLPAP